MAIHQIASARTIQVLKPHVRRLNDGNGLHIRQALTGRKTWYQDYTFQGKRNSISLGHFPELELSEARDKSVEVRRLVAQGINPAVARKEAKQFSVDLTHPQAFQTIAERWFAIQAAEWSQGHAEKTAVRLAAHVYPALGNRVIRTVETKEVTALVEALCEAGTIDTAKRVLSICRRVCDYAVAKGWATSNPCHAVKEVIPAKVTVHHAAVTTPKDLRELLHRISRLRAKFVVQCAVKLTMLALLRSAELRLATWKEIDLDGKVWVIPATRMKSDPDRKANDGPHTVPLSSQAVAILRELKQVTGHLQYVFAGQGYKNPTISGNTINNALRRSGISTSEEQTAHGFRATARTMLVEQLKFEADWAELQLDHVVKDANGEAYNRTQMLPERALMMQKWADYLDWLQQQTPSALAPIGGVAVPVHLRWSKDVPPSIPLAPAGEIQLQWIHTEPVANASPDVCGSPS